MQCCQLSEWLQCVAETSVEFNSFVFQQTVSWYKYSSHESQTTETNYWHWTSASILNHHHHHFESKWQLVNFNQWNLKIVLMYNTVVSFIGKLERHSKNKCFYGPRCGVASSFQSTFNFRGHRWKGDADLDMQSHLLWQNLRMQTQTGIKWRHWLTVSYICEFYNVFNFLIFKNHVHKKWILSKKKFCKKFSLKCFWAA